MSKTSAHDEQLHRQEEKRHRERRHHKQNPDEESAKPTHDEQQSERSRRHREQTHHASAASHEREKTDQDQNVVDSDRKRRKAREDRHNAEEKPTTQNSTARQEKRVSELSRDVVPKTSEEQRKELRKRRHKQEKPAGNNNITSEPRMSKVKTMSLTKTDEHAEKVAEESRNRHAHRKLEREKRRREEKAETDSKTTTAPFDDKHNRKQETTQQVENFMATDSHQRISSSEATHKQKLEHRRAQNYAEKQKRVENKRTADDAVTPLELSEDAKTQTPKAVGESGHINESQQQQKLPPKRTSISEVTKSDSPSTDNKVKHRRDRKRSVAHEKMAPKTSEEQSRRSSEAKIPTQPVRQRCSVASKTTISSELKKRHSDKKADSLASQTKIVTENEQETADKDARRKKHREAKIAKTNEDDLGSITTGRSKINPTATGNDSIQAAADDKLTEREVKKRAHREAKPHKVLDERSSLAASDEKPLKNSVDENVRNKSSPKSNVDKKKIISQQVDVAKNDAHKQPRFSLSTKSATDSDAKLRRKNESNSSQPLITANIIRKKTLGSDAEIKKPTSQAPVKIIKRKSVTTNSIQAADITAETTPSIDIAGDDDKRQKTSIEIKKRSSADIQRSAGVADKKSSTSKKEKPDNKIVSKRDSRDASKRSSTTETTTTDVPESQEVEGAAVENKSAKVAEKTMPPAKRKSSLRESIQHVASNSNKNATPSQPESSTKSMASSQNFVKNIGTSSARQSKRTSSLSFVVDPATRAIIKAPVGDKSALTDTLLKDVMNDDEDETAQSAPAAADGSARATPTEASVAVSMCAPDADSMQRFWSEVDTTDVAEDDDSKKPMSLEQRRDSSNEQSRESSNSLDDMVHKSNGNDKKAENTEGNKPEKRKKKKKKKHEKDPTKQNDESDDEQDDADSTSSSSSASSSSASEKSKSSKDGDSGEDVNKTGKQEKRKSSDSDDNESSVRVEKNAEKKSSADEDAKDDRGTEEKDEEEEDAKAKNRRSTSEDGRNSSEKGAVEK